jgi:RNA polymerase sigma factor (sigma-70 family)
MIQNDEDSQRLIEMYHQYKRLMFKVAQQYFPHDHHEMEDVISDAILKMIDNFSTISAVPCNKTASYIVKIVRSVCNDKLRKRNRQRLDLPLWDAEDNLADVVDVNASNDLPPDPCASFRVS